jgi:hypothetical protein
MGRFILTEGERNRIRGLYEQNTNQDFNKEIQNFAKTGREDMNNWVIKNTFGEDLYKKTSDLAKKFGMTLIEKAAQHHMWSKDLKYGKLILVIANQENEGNPKTAYVGTYGDRDEGKAVKVVDGVLRKTTHQGGSGTYPDFENIVKVYGNYFDNIEPEMNKISKAL